MECSECCEAVGKFFKAVYDAAQLEATLFTAESPLLSHLLALGNALLALGALTSLSFLPGFLLFLVFAIIAAYFVIGIINYWSTPADKLPHRDAKTEGQERAAMEKIRAGAHGRLSQPPSASAEPHTEASHFPDPETPPQPRTPVANAPLPS